MLSLWFLQPPFITLTAGADNRAGTDGADTFDGSAGANVNTPNTLNSFDTITGGNGVDRIIVAQNIADSDFTNTRGVENITTSGRPAGGATPTATTINLGVAAQTAGIVSVNSNAAFTTLTYAAGYTADNGSADLQSAAGVVNNTAGPGGAVTSNTVLFDNAASGTNYRVNFVSGEVGNGSNSNARGLGVSLQREDGADALIGGVSRFSDEGITFASSDATIRFDVRGLDAMTGQVDPMQNRGTFAQVSLGSIGSDNLRTANQAGIATLAAGAGIYLNAGAGNDTLTGSAGSDFLVGGDGNDMVFTEGGRDTVLGGAGNDDIRETTTASVINVIAGDGDDTVTVINALAAVGSTNTRDTLNGGAGTDVLVANFADFTAATAVNAGEAPVITLFENLRFANAVGTVVTTANVQANILGVQYAANSTASTVNFEAGARTVQLNVGGGLGGAVHAFNAAGAGSTDALSLINRNTNAAANAFSGAQVTAGGFEVLNIDTGAAATAQQTLAASNVNASAPETNVSVNITGVNALSFGATTLSSNTTGTFIINASALTAQNSGTPTLILTTGVQAGSGSVSVTGSAGEDTIASTGRAFIDGGAGNDDIAGAAGNDTLLGGDGNDIINLGAGGDDSASGGAGDDRIVVGASANLTGADTLAGGDGRDTLDVSGGAIAAGGQINVSGFEVLSFSNLGAATTQDMVQFINNTTFDTIRVNSTVNNLIIQNATPGIANLVFADNRGAAVVTQFQNLVNTATNTLNVRAENLPTPNVATARNVGTLTLDNGALMGTDILNIGDRTNPLATDSLTVATLNGSDLDTINVSGLIAANITAGTLNGTARNITVNAQTNTGATFTFAGQAAGSNGVQFVLNGSNTAQNTLTGNVNSDTINGGSVADVLSGGAGGDVINGNGGADNITGGDGRDTINGGDGIDTYVYANAGESNITAANALAFDIVTVTAGDIVDPATNVTAVRANEVTILGAASTDGATLLASLNTAFNANGQAGVDAILFEYVTGGRQFLVIDLDNNNNVTAADQIIEIVGTVNTLALTGANVAIS